jgi:uncharacterized coiled-coil protein SlyX
MDEAADRIERLESLTRFQDRVIRSGDTATLAVEEREAVGVAIQCVVAAKAQRHPEEEESHDLLHKTAATLRGLLERMSQGEEQAT